MDAATIILTALTTGAAAAAKSTVEAAIKDTYTGLKTLIQKRFSKVPVDRLEASPDKESWQLVVKEELEDAFPNVDEEVVKEAIEMAQKVLKAIEDKAPETAQAVGIDLKNVKAAASINIKDIDVKGGGMGVTMERVEAGGDIDISNIKVDNTDPN